MSSWRGCFGSPGVERDDPYFPQIPWLETLGCRQVEWKEPWIEDQDVGFCSQHLGHVSRLPFGLTWSGPWQLEYITLKVGSGSTNLWFIHFLCGVHIYDLNFISWSPRVTELATDSNNILQHYYKVKIKQSSYVSLNGHHFSSQFLARILNSFFHSPHHWFLLLFCFCFACFCFVWRQRQSRRKKTSPKMSLSHFSLKKLTFWLSLGLSFFIV